MSYEKIGQDEVQKKNTESENAARSEMSSNPDEEEKPFLSASLYFAVVHPH